MPAMDDSEGLIISVLVGDDSRVLGLLNQRGCEQVRQNVMDGVRPKGRSGSRIVPSRLRRPRGSRSSIAFGRWLPIFLGD